MDTISRENNSMLPVGGIIVGVIALLLGGYAAISISKVNKTLAENQPKIDKIDAVEATAGQAAAAADKAGKDLTVRMREVQAGFDTIGPALGVLQEKVTKMEEAQKKAPPPVANEKGKKGSSGPVVAGPGEYIVKSGDIPSKIAQSNGVSAADLQAVNPGVNWKSLKVGQKLKLPAKK